MKPIQVATSMKLLFYSLAREESQARLAIAQDILITTRKRKKTQYQKVRSCLISHALLGDWRVL